MHITNLQQGYLMISVDGQHPVLSPEQQKELVLHIVKQHPEFVTRDDIHDPYCVNQRERTHS